VHPGIEIGSVGNPSISQLLIVVFFRVRVQAKLRIFMPFVLTHVVVSESSVSKSNADLAVASHALAKISEGFN
jgi:hypothetical protein